MKTTVGAALCALLLWGCGEESGGIPSGGGIPPDNTCTSNCSGTGPGPTTEPPKPAASTSLWPLTTGSGWAYRVQDALRGTFEKTVVVEGPREVPEATGQALSVLSTEPYKQERSWQVVDGGLAFRVREEDLTNGVLDTVTTWRPSTVKNLTDAQSVGWTHSATVHEMVKTMSDGTLEEKDKTYVWTVIAVDEEVTVPAGTFKTIKVQRARAEKTGKEKTYWLAPGVGKVKEDGERLEELVRYEIKE